MLMVCSFFMLFIFTVGKEFQAGNEVASVISSTYAMDSTDILSGGSLETNAYWAETVFHFVS